MRSSWEATEGGATRRVLGCDDDDPAPVVLAGLKSDVRSRVMGDMVVVVDGGVVRLGKMKQCVALFGCCFSGSELEKRKRKYTSLCCCCCCRDRVSVSLVPRNCKIENTVDTPIRQTAM